MRYSFITALVLSAFSLSANAETSEHIIGTNIGYGDVNYDAPTSKESGDMFLGEIYYRYMPTHNFGIEAGYKGAFDGIGWSYKHFGLNAEYMYSKNSDFDSSGVMFGAQLRF
ncbi:TPA: hypothetical protein O4F77_001381 [Vibrio alginolyticus]|nr:hypothetical protein [Vibrio alginolyticus]